MKQHINKKIKKTKRYNDNISRTSDADIIFVQGDKYEKKFKNLEKRSVQYK